MVQKNEGMMIYQDILSLKPFIEKTNEVKNAEWRPINVDKDDYVSVSNTRSDGEGFWWPFVD